MKKNIIIGRESEQAVFSRAIKSGEPEFIAVYGRRRVGKTFLIKEYFKDSILFEVTGIHKASMSEQLDNFAISLGNAAGVGFKPQRPLSWIEAFQQLILFYESPIIKKKRRKKIIFFDELPWINTPRSKFLSALEHFWNSWGASRNDLILIVCGSAASWMIQNIVSAKGGLHNRLTKQIRLLPFTLRETELYLKSRNIKLSRFQIVDIYMAIGGIPHYLKQIESGLSSSQIIDNICFSPDGILRNEFDNLYSSLFDNSRQHIKIVKTLAKKRKGLTRNKILESVDSSSGGTISARLQELEESGFIQSRIPFGKKSNEALYWLSDEYSLFYLDWISKMKNNDFSTGYWQSRMNSPRKRAWAGYAFERVCIKHSDKIKEALGVSKIETEEAPWGGIIKEDKNSSEGVQIDLLIDRRDKTINICEMKFSENEFIIDKKYANELKKKIDIFKKVTKTRKSILLTMVTTFGVKKNTHSKELVQNTIVLDNLF